MLPILATLLDDCRVTKKLDPQNKLMVLVDDACGENARLNMPETSLHPAEISFASCFTHDDFAIDAYFLQTCTAAKKMKVVKKQL